MTQENFTTEKQKKLIQHNEFRILVLLIVLSFSTIFSQSVTSVSPNSAAQGTSGLLVTFIINGDSSIMPPPEAPVNLATIGTIEGTSLTHNDTIVTGIFNIPFTEEIGLKDVAVTFIPPPGQGDPIVFLLEDGFTVTEMPNTPPTIITQPTSKSVRIGHSTSLSVVAYGSSPMSYQWQKEEVDIPGAISSTYSISSFAQSDAGNYRCVITNTFGTVTSETAELTIDTTNYAGVYPIVDTNQDFCYNDSVKIYCPAEGEDFYGQDAQFAGIQPSYTDNGDGTITDNITGLMWAQDQSSQTIPWSQASLYCESLTTGGYSDWRMPTVKELWSIRDFSTGWPWIDTTYFNLTGDGTQMSQHHSWTSNAYLVVSEYQNEQVIGDPHWIVNDWTGHIKAMSGDRFVRAVRGVTTYGTNDFVDNGDGTVTDNATGLMWSQDDNGEMLYWKEALAYAENSTIAGYDDWRLPNIKELQSIADYTVSEIPVLDASVFNLTQVTNIVYDTVTGDSIDSQVNYPFYWSSTSNPIESSDPTIEGGTIYAWALASGYNVDMNGYDLHGAGSIIFRAKTEANSGIEDVIPIMVRLVRDADGTSGVYDDQSGNLEIPKKFQLQQNYPNPFNPSTQITVSIPVSGMYTLKVYNILGQEVAVLLSNQINAGTHTFDFDASKLSSGIYFYNFSGSNFSQTKKMMLMK